jgi:hypothetical protein
MVTYDSLIQLAITHNGTVNATFLVLGIVLGKYRLLLVPLRFLLDRLEKNEEKKEEVHVKYVGYSSPKELLGETENA